MPEKQFFKIGTGFGLSLRAYVDAKLLSGQSHRQDSNQQDTGDFL